MASVVRGYALWLRDRYGVAIQTVLHAPKFNDEALGRRMERDPRPEAQDEYLAALFDPKRTNLNFHCHILYTTREVDAETGNFGRKTRRLDDPKTGKSRLPPCAPSGRRA